MKTTREFPVRPFLHVIFGLAAAAATFLLYWHGLYGSFILDDLPNLSVIASLPPDPGWRDIFYLAQTNLSGILGRPISTSSFLLQYQSWPDPFNFKLINLLIHLCNGFLAGLCCYLLSRQSKVLHLGVGAIIITVFIWLIHPIQVSTVLYVVQRMTELSALFTLAGIACYLYGREIFEKENRIGGLTLMTIGVFLFGLLAMLSKENGALIFAYILVLEITLLTNQDASASLKKVRLCLVYIPLLIGAVGFVFILPGLLDSYALKPFDIQQRTLTQFPVLVNYIANIALLFPAQLGLFHDDFPMVTSLMHPNSVVSLVLIVAVITIALIKRKQWPLFAFAVLWYFAGHAMESTILPLEFYFEHRNYLPLLGPLLAIVSGSQRFLAQAQPGLARAIAALVCVLILSMSFLTFNQAQRWGEPLTLAYSSVEQHPQSARARSNLVQELSNSGEFQKAFEYHINSLDPDLLQISSYIRWLEFRCILPNVPLPAETVFSRQASQSAHDFSAVYMLNGLVSGILNNRCASAPLEQLSLVIDNLLANENFAISKADLLQIQAFYFVSEGNFARAAELAAQSNSIRPDARTALFRISWLRLSDQRDSAAQELVVLAQEYSDDIRNSAELRQRFEYLLAELVPADE